MILAAVLAMALGAAEPVAPAAPREVVVLLNGLARTKYSLRQLHDAIEKAGYRAIDWPYRSWSGSFEAHAARLARDLETLARDPAVARVHAVGHSLGGIVLRRALLDAAPSAKFGRLVQLVPPNHGSGVARGLATVLGRPFPVLAELSDDPRSAVNRLGVPRGIEIGVVAARYDHLVALASTHVEGEADHLLLPASHSFLMNRDDVIAATIAFLGSGRFPR